LSLLREALRYRKDVFSSEFINNQRGRIYLSVCFIVEPK
jgi:hypothetical protein